MVDLISLVQHICHHVWRRCIDNGRRNDIGHVAMILVFRYTNFLWRIELSYSTQVYVTTKNGDSNRLFSCKLLQLLDEPIALLLVVFRCPAAMQSVWRPNSHDERLTGRPDHQESLRRHRTC